ncbi:NTP transferase domain-containing protein [Daeguia caeni]|uniref:NTP transferase domain-containing protein n=1 Tax=Daeguia caeni TaxID=439612 RepID=A0ABV9HBF2_9HYPH
MHTTVGLVVAVLAAGQSKRFGPADKLLSFYHGKALAKHVALRLQNLPFVEACVVTRTMAVAGLFNQPRIKPVFVPPGKGQAASFHAAIQFARKRRASHVLLLLADMPKLTPETLARFCACRSHAPVMARCGKVSLPPVLIPHCLFARLSGLHGDSGAGSILRRLPNIRFLDITPEETVDIDQR